MKMFATYGKQEENEEFQPVGLFSSFNDALMSDTGGLGFFQIWEVEIQKIKLIDEEAP